ncbi:MAG: tetratricopeptide repeat protein [Opitutus sp.]|nr:tetratricopeptide repeat protein [Opitutus sp.]
MATGVHSQREPDRHAVAWRWLALVCLVAAIALAYGNTLHAPFLFDDDGAVLNNPTIRRLDSLAVFHPPADGSTTTGRPVVNITFALNYAISGEHVWSYRVFNIAIHALASLTLFGLFRRSLISLSAQPSTINSSALLAAALWALHPLQTESVTCIAQRTESLCGLFYLLTLYAFSRATVQSEGEVRWPRPAWFAVSVASCLLGMATKEVMVTAPVIVFLYDRTFVARSFASAWRRRSAYYIALATSWLLLAWLVVHNDGARGASAGFGLGIPWWTYLLKQCEALVLYLKLSLWPYPLVLDYGTGVVRSVVEVWWQAIAVLISLVATIGLMKRKPAAGFLGTCFFVVLAPSSSVVPLVTQTMAEHRMYLPLAAIVVVVAIATHAWLGARAKWLLAVVAVGWGGATAARNHDYRDAVSIWADTVARRPVNPRAENNLALSLQRAGRVAEAHNHFSRAVSLDPGYVSARYNWGVVLLTSGRLREAVAQFEAAVRLAPDHADARVNLGNALVQLQRAAEAIPHYQHALRLRRGADAHYNLGVALVEINRPTDAANQFHGALQLNPSFPEAYYQLARLAELAGQLADAEHGYVETLRLAPDHLLAHRKLGLLLARAQHLAPAAEHFRAVIRLAPLDADAHANLGNVLLLQEQPREALSCYEEALRLRPDDLRTRENIRLARESLR